MIFIWFIYGLAFFIFGLAISVYPKKPSDFKLANHLWLIAGFGLIHGINEWLDMFIALEGPLPIGIMKFLRIVTLSVSFLFLLWFGTKLIAESKKKFNFIQFLPITLFVIWAVIFGISKQRLLMGDIFGRYLLCLPGASLTAVGLFLQIPQFKKTKLPAVIRNLYLTAITFLIYGILAGIVVKEPVVPGIGLLNYKAFENVFGIPVQIFRAICAVVLAYSTIKMLSIFRWETREALRKSEQRCGIITAAAPVIVFVQNKDSIITFIQGKGLDLLKLEPERLVGRRFSEIFPSISQFDEHSQRALSGEEFITNATIDGVVFQICYSPLKDHEDETTGVIGVALDVTARIQAESKLDTYRRQIRKNTRLAEIGTISSTMAQQLEEPLAVTRLLMQRLQSDLTKVSTDKIVNDSLKRSLLNITNASEIVEKFRSTAQLPTQTTVEPIDLYQIAKRMMEVFAQSAQQANLIIAAKDVDIIPHMLISIRELEQIFFILIQNAIEAAETDKQQTLIISSIVHDREIELQFADTCSGIEPEIQQHIFEPFFTGQPNNKKTGFGLTIAKQILGAYGGNIKVKSQFGQGTTFFVTLPIERVS